MEEGLDLLSGLPCEIREMVVDYLKPLGITLAYARVVCKRWRTFVPEPVRPQTWHTVHFRRLLNFEADDVCRVAVHLMKQFIWDGADDGIWRDFNEAVEAVARMDKPLLFSYFMRFPRENRRDPYRRDGRAKQPNGISLDIHNVYDMALRHGSERILASVVPALWVLSWEERVALFWANAQYYTFGTLAVLLDHGIVDLTQKSWNGLIEDADPDALICSDRGSFPAGDTRLRSVVQTIASRLSAEGIEQFFGLWVYHLVKNSGNGACLDSIWTATQIVLVSGHCSFELCRRLSAEDRLALHPRMFHLCHCDDAALLQEEPPGKRAKVVDEDIHECE